MEGFSDVTSRAEDIIYDQKFSGAAADLLNANIIARDLGLKEQSQVEDVTPDKEIAISGALVSRSYSTVELDAILDNLSDEEQIELLELLEEEENYRNTHLLYEFTPYSKQREFIDAGHDYPERCFMAGNQLGKSFTGAAEVAFHLTGRYPGTKGYPADGKYGGEWKGKRFYEPVVFWIGGETNETVTKTTQRILCGRIEENGEPATVPYRKKTSLAGRSLLSFRTLLIIFWLSITRLMALKMAFQSATSNHTRKAVLAGRVTQSTACGLMKNHHTAFMAKVLPVPTNTVNSQF